MIEWRQQQLFIRGPQHDDPEWKVLSVQASWPKFKSRNPQWRRKLTYESFPDTPACTLPTCELSHMLTTFNTQWQINFEN